MVSVILVNHNYEEYIGTAIESVLAQTYQHFELIVVDGASTDNSRKIIMSYVNQYPDIITAVFKPTSGQAAAFNVGFKLSRGEIITFLDADDFYYENRLARLIELHEEYDFIGHARKITTHGGTLMEASAPLDEYDKRPELLKKYGYIYTYNLITSCMSLNRTLAEKIFPMPEKGYITFADCYVKVLAQYYSNIKYISEALSYYRIHNTQKTSSFDDNALYQFVVDLYGRVFRDVNSVLEQRNEKRIPILTKEKYRKAFAIANPGVSIYENASYAIYGTGANSAKVRAVIMMLGGKITYAIDSNPLKWGETWNGVKIVSPEQGADRALGFEKIIIGSFYYYEEIKLKLESLGLKENVDFALIHSIPND